MKFLLNLLLTAALAFLAGLVLPWWSVAIAAFLVGIFLPQRTGLDFLSGFLGIFLLWALVAFWLDAENNSILSYKIAALFKLGSSFLLILVASFIGALVGGFAGMAGSSLRPIRRKKRGLNP
jgi:hypothetical protein